MEIKSWEYLDPVESLAHYGIKGMKWGRIRSSKEIREEAAKIDEEIQGMKAEYNEKNEANAYIQTDAYKREAEQHQTNAKILLEYAKQNPNLIAKAILVKAASDSWNEGRKMKQLKEDVYDDMRSRQEAIDKKIEESDILKRTANAVDKGTVEYGKGILSNFFMKYKKYSNGVRRKLENNGRVSKSRRK